MIIILLLSAAVVLVALGHIIKVNRWGQIVSVYETPSRGNLLMSLAIGHTLNAISPVRIGDIVRVIHSGKRMKNGYSLAIATVFADLYVDLITVGIMFFGLAIIGKGGEKLLVIAHRYEIILPIIIALSLLVAVCRKRFKKLTAHIASVFNEKIEYRLMYIVYMCIASLKDIARKINKRKFVILTAGMWICYVGAYMIFAEAVQKMGYNYTTSDVFTVLFSRFNFYGVEQKLLPIWATFMLTPMFICAGVSAIMNRGKSNEIYVRPSLPQMTDADRLSFLKTYYEDENREHIKAYLEINNDVTIIADNSSGSAASTLLVMKDNRIMYRKYAFDDAGKKLGDQINWLEEHMDAIPLTSVLNKKENPNYTSYDMPNYPDAVNMFEYVHMSDVEQNWKILSKVLEDIDKSIHSINVRSADRIQEYLSDKVIKNLSIIKKAMKSFEVYDTLTVNGKEVKTLKYYDNFFNGLDAVFADDIYSDIHGDLTIENIICRGSEYYLIDPNTGNIHESPFLDYAKLLQSLHGNYEFLRTVKNISIEGNEISYVLTKSEAYAELYTKYKCYLNEKFSSKELKSIYAHEIIHWLRLLPYQIRKNEKTAVVYYTVMLELLSEIQTCDI